MIGPLRCGPRTPMFRKNRLDVFPVHATNLGVLRDPFDKVVELSGFQLKPVGNSHCIWDFQHAESQEKGRLLHVEGFLGGGLVSMSVSGTAYMVTRQDFTLALLFSSQPRGMWLNDAKYKVLPKDESKFFPPEWPKEIISRIIRARFRTVVILDESVLLKKIGLRPQSGA